MARSQVSVVNRALDILGATNITAITDASKNARAMNRAYDPVLEDLLNKHDWSFSVKRAELALLTEEPLYEFSSMFALPTDFIRVIEIYPRYLRYRREGDNLLADATSLKLKYVSKISDPNKFTAEFAELLSKALAKETCFKITQSRAKESDMEEKFKKYFFWATSNDSKSSGTAQPMAEDDWMVHRGYGSSEYNNAVVSESFDYGSVS